MIRAEVLELLADAMGKWPHIDLTADATVGQYVRDLADVDAELARLAVEAFYRDGERFPPNGAAIVGKVADLAIDAPDWGVVKAELVRRHHRHGDREPGGAGECPFGECDGRGLVIDWDSNTASDCRCRPDLVRRARVRQVQSPVVNEFLALVGAMELRDLLAGDRIAEAQVRTKYEAFVRDIRRDVTYQGLEPGVLPGVDRHLEQAQRRNFRRVGPARPEYLQLVEGGEQ
jgi:hypothetical protein